MSTHLISVATSLSARRSRRRRRRDLPCNGSPRDDRNVKKSLLRVLGPYAEPYGFRLVVIEGTARKALKYKSLEEAEQAKSQLHSEIQKRVEHTVGEAIDEFEVAMVRERGCLESTAQAVCPRLARFLPKGELLRSITPNRAAALYVAETERVTPGGRLVAVATHHLLLDWAKSFFRWCVEKNYVSENPFAKVRKLGRRKTGKLQLTADEARRFLDAAMTRIRTGDAGALAVALQLSLGLRSSEVLSRRVRDVDENGSILIIPDGKTENARRRPQVPDFLRPHLLSLIQDKRPDAFIFGVFGTEGARTTYLRRRVHDLCKQAGVPIVCPHSLRGLHATLALRQGVSSQAVAAALGHSSFAITARHYADPSALLDARVRNVLIALKGTQSDPQSLLPELAQRIQSALSTSDIATLIDLLQKPTAA